jgi:hypothetical protein
VLSFFDVLIGIKNAVALIKGVNTCNIGMEHTINAADYPMVRIVPSIIKIDLRVPRRQSMDIIVYYGDLLHEFEGNGLQDSYAYFLDMDAKIRNAIVPGQGWCAEWIDTTMDEDRLPGYKLFAARYSIN